MSKSKSKSNGAKHHKNNASKGRVLLQEGTNTTGSVYAMGHNAMEVKRLFDRLKHRSDNDKRILSAAGRIAIRDNINTCENITTDEVLCKMEEENTKLCSLEFRLKSSWLGRVAIKWVNRGGEK